MNKYRKKPVVVEAVQWLQNGDHPLDNSYVINADRPFLSEGELVRYYRTPEGDSHRECNKCGKIMHVHGWIDTLEGGHIVRYYRIIKGIKGEFHPCKPDIFEATYERVEDDE